MPDLSAISTADLKSMTSSLTLGEGEVAPNVTLTPGLLGGAGMPGTSPGFSMQGLTQGQAAVVIQRATTPDQIVRDG